MVNNYIITLLYFQGDPGPAGSPGFQGPRGPSGLNGSPGNAGAKGAPVSIYSTDNGDVQGI